VLEDEVDALRTKVQMSDITKGIHTDNGDDQRTNAGKQNITYNKDVKRLYVTQLFKDRLEKPHQTQVVFFY
jgi:hypothetical protein